MQLCDGKISGRYCVGASTVPEHLQRRLEALGMTEGATLEIIHKKHSGTMVIVLRGTRFALGKDVTRGISVEEVAHESTK